MLDRNGAEAILNDLLTAKQIGAEVADGAAKALSPAIEAERAMRALTNPAPATAAKPESAPAPSYRQGDQRELDRPIGTQR